MDDSLTDKAEIDMINGVEIVDGHVHTFCSEEVSRKILTSFNKLYSIEFQNPGTGSIEDVLKNMKRTGIDYTVMANFAPPKIIHENNIWTLETAVHHPNLIPLVSFHPEMDGFPGDYFEAYMAKGAKGVKIHPMAQGFAPDYPGMDAVYGLCGQLRLPVEFHCGRVANARLNAYADIEMILPVIRKYPDVPFILTHMADGDPDMAAKLAREYGNVYFDTSIVVTGYPPIMETNEPSWLDDDMVVEMIAAIGADRVLFGSDYPWGSPRHDIARMMKMKMGVEQKHLVFGGNAIRIFRIKTE